jgi:hypothetical protein
LSPTCAARIPPFRLINTRTGCCAPPLANHSIAKPAKNSSLGLVQQCNYRWHCEIQISNPSPSNPTLSRQFAYYQLTSVPYRQTNRQSWSAYSFDNFRKYQFQYCEKLFPNWQPVIGWNCWEAPLIGPICWHKGNPSGEWFLWQPSYLCSSIFPRTGSIYRNNWPLIWTVFCKRDKSCNWMIARDLNC